MEAVKDSDSSGNVSLEDQDHPGPAHGSTGEGPESSIALPCPRKCAETATATLAVGKLKGDLPHPGPEACKETTGTALPTATAAAAPAGGIAGSKAHNPSPYPEASRSSTGPAPIALEQ